MINPFRKTYSNTDLEMFEFIKGVRVFENLSNKQLALFLPFLYLREYNMDEVIFFRNDPSNALYIVKKGDVSLNIDIDDSFEKLTNATGGKAFGDNVFLDKSKRIYNAVVCSETATLYVIPKVNIFEIFEGHPDIKAKVMSSLAALYNDYTQKLFKAYKSASGFFNLSQAYDE
jgi:CRP/FNR family transcriptional regulator, cyclic AMP receptor protein